MRPLSAHQILQIWEIGQPQHPLDRAITLLSFGLPDKTGDELTRLSIGQRDAYLLTLRELTLGPTLESFAQCPQCGESLEFTLNAADLRVVPSAPVIEPEYALTIDEFELRFTLPNSQDLAAVVSSRDVTTASQRLTQRCLRQVSREGAVIDPNQLPVRILTQLSQHMAECDPQAELLLDLNCPACQHTWQVLFDIVSFFWMELSVQAKRLMREVNILARSYGWREADILSMSAMRRQFYLDLVT